MIKIKEILSATNITILIIMAGGNFLFDIVSNVDEFKKVECIREGIYHNATEDNFTNCMINAGIFDSNGLAWIFLQFVLILASIVIASIVESKTAKKRRQQL